MSSMMLLNNENRSAIGRLFSAHRILWPSPKFSQTTTPTPTNAFGRSFACRENISSVRCLGGCRWWSGCLAVIRWFLGTWIFRPLWGIIGLCLRKSGHTVENRIAAFDYAQAVQKVKVKTPDPVGLANLGNTCYFNSSMQCVAQTVLLKMVLQEAMSVKILTETNWEESVAEWKHDRNVLVLCYADEQDKSLSAWTSFAQRYQDCDNVVFAKRRVSGNGIPSENGAIAVPVVLVYRPFSDEVSSFTPGDEEIIDKQVLALLLSTLPQCSCWERGIAGRILSNVACYVGILCTCKMYAWRYDNWVSKLKLLKRPPIMSMAITGIVMTQLVTWIGTHILSARSKLRTSTWAMQSISGALEDFNRKVTRLDSAFCPHDLFGKLCERSSRFLGGRQQDSHELLRHLMDGVKEEEKEKAGADPDQPYRALTTVDRVFGGHFVTVFYCHCCKTPYHLFEPFLDISLPIAFQDSTIQSQPDVDDSSSDVEREAAVDTEMLSEYRAAAETILNRASAVPDDLTPDSVLNSLRFYTRKEQLDEYLCLECNKGKSDYTLTRGSKQTIIYNPPAVLTVHLKRFEQTADGYEKVSKFIRFEPDLDLAPFCSQYSLRQQKSEPGSIRYSLYGVVVHSGNLKGGHYTACVRVRTVDVAKTKEFLQKEFLDREALMDKNELIKLVEKSRTQPSYLEVGEVSVDDSRWFDISDSCVGPTSEENVLSKEAYLLFYERVF